MTGVIYLDHNASTPVDPVVIEQMVAAMQRYPANPSAVDHFWGQAAHQAIEDARGAVAAHLGARANDLIFTSGATEANNIAIRGGFRATRGDARTRIVTAATEHPSVSNTVVALEREGAEVVTLPVDEEGRIDLNELRAALTPATALVTIMGANNETGVIHPVAEIASICAKASVPYHCDMTQLAAHLPIDLDSLGVTMASLSGHKIYGPKGIGLLYARSRRPRARIDPPSTGGGQERGLRPGTPNTEGALGLRAAFACRASWLASGSELAKKRDALEFHLSKIAGLRINGGGAMRIPNTLNVSIDGIDPHALQHRLRDSIVFSTSSACSTDKVRASTVLTAMFGEGARAKGGFRLGLGKTTTWDDVDRAGSLISAAVDMLREGRVGRFDAVAITG